MLSEITDENGCKFNFRLTKDERLQLKLLSIYTDRDMNDLAREALADLQVKYAGTIPLGAA